jgi:hypothetical protein
MRGDRTFAYDLVMRHGAVSGRVVLLLRSTEAKPFSLLSVRIHSPIPVLASAGPLRDSMKYKVSPGTFLSSVDMNFESFVCSACCYFNPGSLVVCKSPKLSS